MISVPNDNHTLKVRYENTNKCYLLFPNQLPLGSCVSITGPHRSCEKAVTSLEFIQLILEGWETGRGNPWLSSGQLSNIWRRAWDFYLDLISNCLPDSPWLEARPFTFFSDVYRTIQWPATLLMFYETVCRGSKSLIETIKLDITIMDIFVHVWPSGDKDSFLSQRRDLVCSNSLNNC